MSRNLANDDFGIPIEEVRNHSNSAQQQQWQQQQATRTTTTTTTTTTAKVFVNMQRP